MDPDYQKQIINKIDLIYQKIAKSGNKNLIKQFDQKKHQLYESIPKSDSMILKSQLNRDYIDKYLDKFLLFVNDQNNLASQGFFTSFFKESNKTKIQNVFAEKFLKLPKYFKGIEQQDVSVSTFNNDSIVNHCKVPFNFTAYSYHLDQEIDNTICITLIFQDFTDENVFVHSLSAKKLQKKIPELKKLDFLQPLEKILTITIEQEKNVLTLQSLDPIVQFSPSIPSGENKNIQEFYLFQDMEIVLSPTFKLKVVDIFYEQQGLNYNFNSNKGLQQYDTKLLLQNAKNYIILQPIELNIEHEKVKIFDLKREIVLNNIINVPTTFMGSIIFDGNGFLYKVLKESGDFYTSLSTQQPVHSNTKKLRFSLIIKNQLKIEIDSEGGQLFFDSNEFGCNPFE